MMMTHAWLTGWCRQPTTVAGFSALSGLGAALLLHQVAWQSAVPIAVAGLVGMVLPDNAGAKMAVSHLVTDAIQAEELIVKPQNAVITAS